MYKFVLSKVVKSVCRRLKVWLSLSVTVVCILLSLYVRFLTVKVWDVYFQTHSPLIASVELKRRGDVRRAKLYYLRDLSGKAARIKRSS